MGLFQCDVCDVRHRQSIWTVRAWRNLAGNAWMFLFPLIGGVIGYSFIRSLPPKNVTANGFRSFSNLYNSGIATLTVGSFLQGVLEIAGTNSIYVPYFYVIGAALLVAGLSSLFTGWAKKNRTKQGLDAGSMHHALQRGTGWKGQHKF